MQNVFDPYLCQGIQEWTKQNLWKTTLKKIGPFLNTLTHLSLHLGAASNGII